MVQFFSNLPDDDHVPYKFLEANPHIKDVVRYMRQEDYAVGAAVGLGFPAAHYIWERLSPSFHPRVMPRVMAVQIPFYASVGFIFACKRSLFRFWGWTENNAEATRWAKEIAARPPAVKKGWQDLDW
ncbi:NADH-ubiquinone oxidoreductase complex I, 21 kDa subunit-domain-containing protein [Fimicolochytrium jonesii]|uniref:NADH-ubiquinone oxidoreductase complex I, 21 kDa subunit-domain-containing protein n=1 Tax=Fimicolochytrium jonesii TaxID=1396493 RepID=UPI0022FF2F78|nr:NADH-ubiquinone oxidoreductase complex I, 21 kDa subunit-domain-containing protein [Fimicolochytrium jonesii]KAI8825085.1 NADH-ubiquinone oxidoreductase complex I, 21 kDa subunit-domain-containing protein [Fimicolochytrium jonesii]